jgi:DNA-binding HxlR family transcriptional regulator
MHERPAASFADNSSSNHGSHPGATGVAGVGTAAVNCTEKPPGTRTGCENPDLGRWHEAGPAAGLVARRWALEVLRVLDERGATRFNDLRRATGAAGQPLAATLEALARAGLVTRHVICHTPPQSVEYCLTPAARDLFPVLSLLASWHRTNGASGAEPRGDLPVKIAEASHLQAGQ